jgi:hypothetical protein
MGNKTWFLSLSAGALAALVGLAVFFSQQKEAARHEKLQQNLREAGFGGAADLAHAPQARFNSQTFDVGLVNPLDQVSRLITVQNQGRKPLKVRLLDQACSCVAVVVKDEKIAVGQSGVIEITFTAPPEEKDVSHTILLSTNDPLQKQVTIQVAGFVRRTVWTEPRELDFAGLLPGETRERELRVFSAWEEGCEVTRLSGLPEQVEVQQDALGQAELEAAGAASGRLLKVKFPADWQGRHSAPLTFDVVRSGAKDSLSKSVRVNASRQSRLSLSHDLLDVLGRFEIGNIPYGAGRQYTLFLEARGANKQLKLGRVDVEPAFLKVSLEPGVNVATSGLHRLRFEIPADAPEGSYAGEDQGSVTLHFDTPEYPAVTFHPMFHITRD